MSRLLLALLPALLLGCPAEQLGVELPKGGLGSLSPEDLRRDLWMLDELGARPIGSAAYTQGQERIQHRLEQMHLLPGFGRSYRRELETGEAVCGLKDGRSTQAVVIAALDAQVGASRSLSQIALLISLAKIYDTPAKPPLTLVFCVLPESGLDAYAAAPALPLASTKAILALGPVAGADMRSEQGELQGTRLITVSTTAEELWGGEQDTMDRIDLARMLSHTKRVKEAVEDLGG